MSKLFLIRNPELFQGKKYLNKNKNVNYFEGWYFKNTINDFSIAFIPGINIDSKNKKAFIQIITNNSSYFIDYDIKDFKYNKKPFYIKIGKNIFSKKYVYLNIFDKKQNIKINGFLNYEKNRNIKTNFLNPNIMGPFSYIPFMECNHAILSMQNKIYGLIYINNKKINFNGGIGYIEKDWGISFPKNYIWCQGNNFQKNNASFMFSIANIPFKFLEFKGIICVLKFNNKEFKFTTYNNTKLIEYKINKNYIFITLKKGNYFLNIKSKNNESQKLSAPVEGKMEKNIFESINSSITLTLQKNNRIIFSDTSANCGLEIVNDF